ncbi:MAG: TRAP transporter substrate-binding protein [Pseudomonadota bacterium]
MAEPREVRIASHVSEFSPLHAQSTLFAEAIEARLPSQFEFKLFPSGQLGKEKDLITNIPAGSREMINVASGVMKLDNMKVIGVYESGFRHVINSERAVAEPFDLEGLNIRISGGKFRQQVFQNRGATPQKVSWDEAFTALQTGVVDGAEAATYGFYKQKHFEVAGFLSLTGHVYAPSFLVASNAFFGSLTPEQQVVFVEVGREIADAAYDASAALATT